MVGIFAAQFRNYAIESFGVIAWEQIALAADIENCDQFINRVCGERMVLGLVELTSSITGLRAGTILEGFGFYLVPNILNTFSVYVNPKWKTLDFIESMELRFCNYQRLTRFRKEPCPFTVNRVHKHRIIIDNHSSNMLNFSIGFIKGLSTYYKETNRISMSVCTLGDVSKIQIVEKEMDNDLFPLVKHKSTVNY